MADKPVLVIPLSHGLATYNWRFLTTGKLVTVTMGFVDTLGSNDGTAAATAHRGALVAVGSPCNAPQMDTRWRFEGVNVILRTTAGVLTAGQNLTPVTGTATAPTNDQPLFSPWVITKLTQFTGRQYRGRMYVPWLYGDEAVVDAVGNITGSVVAAQQTIWTAYLNAVNATNFQASLLHTALPGNIPPAPDAISALLVRSVVGIQRRRRVRGA